MRYHKWIKRRRSILLTKKRTTRKQRRKLKRSNYSYSKERTLEIQFPYVLSLMHKEHRKNLLNAIVLVHKYLLNGSRRFLFDFSVTHLITPSAMLLFFAEVKNIVSAYPAVKFRYRRPTNQRSAQVFVQLGLAKLFGETRQITPNHKDVVHWQVAEGAGTDGRLYDDVVNEDKISTGGVDLYGGFIEAVKNVRNHAYIEQRALSPVKSTTEWWMFSQVKDGYLTVAICDLGIGIAATLPKKRPHLWQMLTSLGSPPKESTCIMSTIKQEVSRTNKDYRGNGLPRIVEIAQTCKGAALRIYSNKGLVQVTPDKLGLDGYDFRKSSIQGTIIEWCIPIEE